VNENGNDDLFRQAMGDVKPLDVEEKVILKTVQQDLDNTEVRRRAAVADVPIKEEVLSGDFVKPVSPHDILEFKRPGIQHGVYKNLRMGKYKVDARLDLHRLSVEKSREAVAQFIQDCLANDIRCALITHGKGMERQPQPALLKSCVNHWLPQLPSVMAFHSAQKHHGGVGATYVLLKKSEKKKQDTAEKHQKRKT
jgi:DNA-nicking Smr family endonuclease